VLCTRIVQELRQPLEAAKGIEEEYLGNPLHSFPLIRHMYQDWRYIEEFMNKTVGEGEAGIPFRSTYNFNQFDSRTN